MAFPLIIVRHPRPHDIVDDPVEVAGVGTGFEGNAAGAVAQPAGGEIAHRNFQAGGTRHLGQLLLPHRRARACPPSRAGRLEIFEFSAEDGSEINKHVIPIVYGRRARPAVQGFAIHTVRAGETLSGDRRPVVRRSGQVPDHLRGQPQPAHRPGRDPPRPGPAHPAVARTGGGRPHVPWPCPRPSAPPARASPWAAAPSCAVAGPRAPPDRRSLDQRGPHGLVERESSGRACPAARVTYASASPSSGSHIASEPPIPPWPKPSWSTQTPEAPGDLLLEQRVVGGQLAGAHRGHRLRRHQPHAVELAARDAAPRRSARARAPCACPLTAGISAVRHAVAVDDVEAARARRVVERLAVEARCAARPPRSPPRRSSGARELVRPQADVDVERPRARDLLAPERAQRAAVGAAHELAARGARRTARARRGRVPGSHHGSARRRAPRTRRPSPAAARRAEARAAPPARPGGSAAGAPSRAPCRPRELRPVAADRRRRGRARRGRPARARRTRRAACRDEYTWTSASGREPRRRHRAGRRRLGRRRAPRSPRPSRRARRSSAANASRTRSKPGCDVAVDHRAQP